MGIPSSDSPAARPSRRGVLAVTAAMALSATGLAACGASTSSSSSGCTSPGVTSQEVKVAVIDPQTGPSATTFDGFLQAAKARFALQNDEGGVNGRKITVVSGDDMGDGAQQVAAARNAVQSQQVFGVLSASRVDTMYDYLKQQNVPVLGYPGQPAYAANKNAFGFAGASATGYVSTAQMLRMKEGGATNLANLAHNSAGAINSAKGIDFAAEKVGLKVGMKQWDIPLGSFDATAVAIKMKRAGVDALSAQLLTDSSVSILKALRAQGVKLKSVLVAGVYDPKVSSQISDLLQGAIVTPVGTVPTELGTPATKKYVDTMAKYAPDTPPNVGFAGPGYVSADLFIRGLEAAGSCVSRSNFIDSLRKVKDYDGAGLLVTPAVFAPAELPNGTPYVKCAWYAVYKGTAWVPDAEATCGELYKFD